MSKLNEVLARTPRPVYVVLRKARTVVFWLVGPFDALIQASVGRRHIPPLWLRRHVGTVSSFDRANGEISAVIATEALIRDGDHILDIGCGSGAMVPDFQRMMGANGRYIGFDVHAASIAWCQRQFGSDRRLTFELARVNTPYSEQYVTPASEYRFPCEDAWANFALAKSVFTHLLETDARNYLSQLSRSLTPGGHALLTAFLLSDRYPAKAGTGEPLYTFRYGSGDVRWLVEAKPTAGVAYDETHLSRMISDAGLRVKRILYGYWRGGGVGPNTQDLIVVERPTASS